MNFEYSPGLFGYGIRGADGSIGLSGLGLYFTDYDPYSYMTVITYAINNNESLISTSLPGTKLSGGKTYVNGELIVDARGYIWEINNTTKRYSLTPGRLLSGNYFVKASAQTSNDFERYYNDPSTKYIIDAVHSISAKPNYTLFPSNIYGILPKDFTRIEYSDVIDSSRNAFTVYSSGEIELSDDNESFAIVREISGNTFRIGNISTTNSLRNTNILFDVSSLRKNSNLISLLTPTGELLSNSEINANSLFNPNTIFNTRPNSFIASSNATDASIVWILSDFTLDSSIYGDLYVYEKNVSPDNAHKTMVFHNINSSGYVKFSNITVDTSYCYYMSIIKNGWIRNSDIKEFKIGEGNKTLTITAPASKIIDVSANGSINGLSKYNLRFTTNSSNWSISSDSWINCVTTSGIWTDCSTDVSVNVNNNSFRQGYIYVTAGPLTETVTVRQSSGARSLFSSPSHIRFNQYGGLYPGYTNMIQVSTSIDVSWEISASQPWITIIDSGVHINSGSFNFIVNSGSNSAGVIYVYSTDISTYVNIIRQTI